ncbi:MAG: hypothetical protein ABIN91_22325 [Mucilaginibacter sp.]|uniref:hypothetical protein n=1 Tax=Mucilaginibacter sp. TaxID=1882438 RepID=UPI003265C3D5
MAISQKHDRTYHYPFSPGTTSDDRITHDYWEHQQRIPNLTHTEKLVHLVLNDYSTNLTFC